MRKLSDLVGLLPDRFFVKKVSKKSGKTRLARFGLPLVCQCLLMIGMLFIGVVFLMPSEDDGNDPHGRALRNGLCTPKTDAELEDDCPTPPHAGYAPLLLMGILYIFCAIAVVCDEFFVPALEEISNRLEIKDDVAGATLMAAGGSAPELATSLIGTFTGSDVGFGTIVGSAVFNVLFVIACCVAYTPKEFAPLELTWWPLARDCTYYILCLITLAIFFGVNTPGKIELWEAIVLFMMYLGYCTFMYFNEDLQDRFVKKKIAPVAALISANQSGQTKEVESQKLSEDENYMRRHSLFQPSKFRSGLFSTHNNGLSFFDNAGVGVVYRLKGNVKEIFEDLDSDKSGVLEKSEVARLLKVLFSDSALEITDSQVEELMVELDVDQNGVVDFNEFSNWYLKSEQRLKHEEQEVFQDLDKEHSGTIPVADIFHMLYRLDVVVEEAELKEIVQHFLDNPIAGQDKERITFDQFTHWFESSPYWKKKKDIAEEVCEEAEGIWGEVLDFPKDNFKDNAFYIFMAPINWPLALSAGLKDVRIPGNEAWCYYEFFMSIMWIGIYAFIMVDWVTTFGLIIHVPAVVMGLTLLAAGTSVPDLLSSIVVAKTGRGDMAVSSSIGSNIFDITVGLPVPWILFNAWFGCPVIVGADNLVISIVILTVMVLIVILTIMLSNWKMSPTLGYTMMVLYVIFLVQDITRVFLSGSVKC
jgi:K+-dependent Na+/Ca+ exchanger-like protein